MGKERLNGWWFSLGWFARPLALVLIILSPVMTFIMLGVNGWSDFVEFNRTAWKIVTRGVGDFENPRDS